MIFERNVSVKEADVDDMIFDHGKVIPSQR